MARRPNLDKEPIHGSLSDYTGMMTGLLKPRQLILGHHDDRMPPPTPDNTTDQALLPVRERIERTRPGNQLIQPPYVNSTRLLH